MNKIFIELDLETQESGDILKNIIEKAIKRAFFIEPEIRRIEIFEFNEVINIDENKTMEKDNNPSGISQKGDNRIP